jgi:predicted phage terminase large subunit-like protein
MSFEATSFGAYIIDRFPEVQIAAHHQRIIRKLMKVESGEIKRLIITAPPRHSKSILTSEFFPAWCLGRDPRRQIICATYGAELSLSFGRRVKEQLSSEEFRRIFPLCRVKEDSCAANRIDTTARGRYFATSVGGACTGAGSSILIIDDACKGRAEAESPTIRDTTWEWYTAVARTRLMPNGSIVVMGTRWHEDDLSGRLLAQGGWDHLHLPAIDDDGAALWPEWFPLEQLHEIKREIGSYDFEALYQGRPVQRGGGIIQVDKAGRFDMDRLPPMQRLILSVDTAAKTKDMNDYSVIVLMGKAQDGIYVLGVWRQRVEYPALKAAVRSQFEAHAPEMVCIEDSSAGTAVIQELRVDGGLPIKAVRAVADKVTRATPLAAGIECGRLKLPNRAPWLQDLETELGQFPAGKHDDQVDALALGYAELHMTASVVNIRNPMYSRNGPLDLRRR